MTKDAYYFPHFCNARHDRKIKRVTKQLGVEGYGIYFMLLEVLREQSDYRYPICDVDLLADEFGTSEAKVIAVVKNYELFTIDTHNMFFSENLIVNMQPYLKMKEQRILAGKASAEKRKQLQPFNDRSTTVQQSKVKNTKVKQTKEKESNNIDFEIFWNLYDKKEQKDNCMKKWNSLDFETQTKIIEILPSFVAWKSDKQFRPNPQTFLNGKRWLDEIPKLTITPKYTSQIPAADNEWYPKTN